MGALHGCLHIETLSHDDEEMLNIWADMGAVRAVPATGATGHDMMISAKIPCTRRPNPANIGHSTPARSPREVHRSASAERPAFRALTIV